MPTNRLSQTPTGPADMRRKARLNSLVADLERGINAAHEIWGNWSERENFGQDHPGMSAGEYIASLGFRLSLPEALAALTDGTTRASTREVAAVAGVDHATVARARVANATPDQEPVTVRGADGKRYSASGRKGEVAETLTSEAGPIDVDPVVVDPLVVDGEVVLAASSPKEYLLLLDAIKRIPLLKPSVLDPLLASLTDEQSDALRKAARATMVVLGKCRAIRADQLKLVTWSGSEIQDGGQG